MAARPTDDETSAEHIVEEAVELVASWLEQAQSDDSRTERAFARRMTDLIGDEGGVRFTMRFVDRVARHRDDRLAAGQLAALVRRGDLPDFLGRLDRVLLRVGGRLAPIVPWIVVPLARRRMRQLVGHLVVDAEPDPMGRHFSARRDEGYSLNVNLLGEAVLGEEEAPVDDSDRISRRGLGFANHDIQPLGRADGF